MSEIKNETIVEVRLNGPLRVSCDNILITNHDGVETTKESIVSFCRCGKSQKQPFCDGAHKEAEPFE